MDRGYSTPTGRQTPHQASAKVSSRRPVATASTPYTSFHKPLPSISNAPTLHRSPPLTTSLLANTAQPPSVSYVLPKEGAGKLRIKSIQATDRCHSPLVPRTIPSNSIPSRSTGLGSAVASAAKRLHRAITPSDSGGSWAEHGALSEERGDVVLEEPVEELSSSENVLVTVR